MSLQGSKCEFWRVCFLNLACPTLLHTNSSKHWNTRPITAGRNVELGKLSRLILPWPRADRSTAVQTPECERTLSVLLLSRLFALVWGEPKSTQSVRWERTMQGLGAPRADTTGPPNHLHKYNWEEGEGNENKTKTKKSNPNQTKK